MEKAVLFYNKETGKYFAANSRKEAEAFIIFHWGEEAYSLKYLRDIYDWNINEVHALSWRAKVIKED